MGSKSKNRTTPTTNEETRPLLNSPTSSPPPPLRKFNLALGLPLSADIPSSSSQRVIELSFPVIRSHAFGLYKSILTQHLRFRIHYHVLEAIFYTTLFLQILIGALIAPFSPEYTTALGIANVVLAGILGIMKNQALTEKAAGNEYEMRKVRDWIEEYEARLMSGWGDDMMEEELDKLVEEAWDRYAAAREVVERNRLGRFGTAKKVGARGGEESQREGKGRDDMVRGGPGHGIFGGA